jgi:hypothetical protein
MMFSSTVKDFPEFVDNGQGLYQLDRSSKDEDELINRGEKLVSQQRMPVEDFKIKQDGDYYALYVR